jgi:hypothetical protein
VGGSGGIRFLRGLRGIFSNRHPCHCGRTAAQGKQRRLSGPAESDDPAGTPVRGRHQ